MWFQSSNCIISRGSSWTNYQIPHGRHMQDRLSSKTNQYAVFYQSKLQTILIAKSAIAPITTVPKAPPHSTEVAK